MKRTRSSANDCWKTILPFARTPASCARASASFADWPSCSICLPCSSIWPPWAFWPSCSCSTCVSTDSIFLSVFVWDSAIFLSMSVVVAHPTSDRPSGGREEGDGNLHESSC